MSMLSLSGVASIKADILSWDKWWVCPQMDLFAFHQSAVVLAFVSITCEDRGLEDSARRSFGTLCGCMCFCSQT